MVKENFYIITGGPGGGKTTLLEKLTLKGYKYVPETARQIIKDRLSKGLPPRPDPITFANELFAEDLSKFKANSNDTSLLFFDRSFLDSAYLIFDFAEDLYRKIENNLLENRFNSKVFITPPWIEIYHEDTERDQTFDQAVKVYHHLYKWYESHHYDIIELPKESVDYRVEFILRYITN